MASSLVVACPDSASRSGDDRLPAASSTASTAASFTSSSALRAACRTGHFTSPTAGHCAGRTQANLLVLPSRFADDFRRLCKRNPVPCPLLGEGAPGQWKVPERLCGGVRGEVAAKAGAAHTFASTSASTEDGPADVRTDLPSYHIYSRRSGALLRVQKDIRAEWTDEMCAFYVGCSFSFEAALIKEGLVPRHVELGTNVPMYRTNIPLCPSGVFSGHMVVSMRPYRPEDIERVRNITRPFIAAHGEPVAWGPISATSLGIASLSSPDFGSPVPIRPGEVPVFWGCGVTPQVAAMETFARLARDGGDGAGAGVDGNGGGPEEEIVIGHSPGHMLVCDLPDEAVCE